MRCYGVARQDEDRMKRNWLLLCLPFAIAACSPKPPDLSEARRGVAAADSVWAAAAAARDLEGSVNAMAEDGVMFPPGQAPIAGRDAIRKYMSEAMATPGFSIRWETTEIQVASSGDLAYTIGKSWFTVPHPTGATVTIPANAVGVWRRERGEWRCVVDMWNEAPQ